MDKDGHSIRKCVYLLIFLTTGIYLASLYYRVYTSKGFLQRKRKIHSKSDISQSLSKSAPSFNITWSDISNRLRRRKRYSTDTLDYKTAFQLIGAYLAVHKYFGIDIRYQDSVVKNFHRSFMAPPLAHERIFKLCGISFRKCVSTLFETSKKSPALRNLIADKFTHMPDWQDYTKMSKGKKHFYPFASAMEHLAYKSTAVCYMCWYTMMKEPKLAHFMDGGNCLQLLNSVGLGKVVDYRMDDKPFQCAVILYCPDFCYGRKQSGNVYSSEQKKTDKGNPCRKFRNKTCTIVPEDNDDFLGLVWNRFNVTCSCSGKGRGYKYDAELQSCVDIDECVENRYDCRYGKICKNVIGGYICTCRQGFRFNMDVQMCETPSETRTRELNHLKRTKKHATSGGSLKLCDAMLFTVLAHALSLVWDSGLITETSFLFNFGDVYLYFIQNEPINIISW